MSETKRPRVAIIGAGPGGLACGMILAHRGCDVTVYEKRPVVGGRNSPLVLGDYTFDCGPTFLMMRFVLDSLFELVGRKSTSYLTFIPLQPMYTLTFADGMSVNIYSDPSRMEEELSRLFPGNEPRYRYFLSEEKKRYEKLFPCLTIPYTSWTEFLQPHFIAAIPHILTPHSLFDTLGKYFSPERLRLCFTFQSKYLGMSPWVCPGAFAMIPYVEHAYGIFHVKGGLHKISQAMARVIEEEGGSILLKEPVDKIIVKNRRAVGVQLSHGRVEPYDEIVINADFGHAMTHLFSPGVLKKYTFRNLMKKSLSCSTFMIYLGLRKRYSSSHHNIFFARDYRKNVEDIFTRKILSDDPSFYIQNASVTDPSLAPPGKSTLYILVPVPNNTSGIDWSKQERPFTERVLDVVESRTPFHDIRDHIEEMHIISPRTWDTEYDVFQGATFNLAHTLDQMLYFRPHNQFEEVDRCYLVGGGTHPGSGLPTIYESGRISAELILKRHGLHQH